jgi:hypothetical protein
MFKRKMSRDPKIGDTCVLNSEIREKLLEEGNSVNSKYLLDQSQRSQEVTKKTAFVEHAQYFEVKSVSPFNKNLLILEPRSARSVRTTWINNRVVKTKKRFTVSKKCLVLKTLD